MDALFFYISATSVKMMAITSLSANFNYLAYSRLIFFHFHNKAFQSLQGHVIKNCNCRLAAGF